MPLSMMVVVTLAGPSATAGGGRVAGRRGQRHAVALVALDQGVVDVGRVKLKPALALKVKSKISVLPDRVTPVVAISRASMSARKALVKSAASAPLRPLRQGDGDVDAGGDARIDRFGQMNGVAVGAALVDGRAVLGEREGLRAAGDDGGDDAGVAGTDGDGGGGRIGGRRDSARL